jgi:hypothetical protein
VAVVFPSKYFHFLFVKLFVGDWLENRRGAPNCLKLFLLNKVVFGAPLPIRNGAGPGGIGAPIIFKLCFADFFHVRSAITISAGCISAPLVLADYKEDDHVRCPSPIFMHNRL